jgi:cell division protein FtsL
MEADKKYYRQTNAAYWTDGSSARVLRPEEKRPIYTTEDGNAVRRNEEPYDFPIPEQQPVQRPERAPEKAPREHRMPKPRIEQNINFLSLCILVAAIGLTLYTCISYLKVQSDTVVITKNIRQLEQQLTNLQNMNEAAYNEVLSQVNLDEVYQIAVRDLGMVFPNNNTTYYYKSGYEGYVRQFDEIPESEKMNLLKQLLK